MEISLSTWTGRGGQTDKGGSKGIEDNCYEEKLEVLFFGTMTQGRNPVGLCTGDRQMQKSNVVNKIRSNSRGGGKW